jgi:Ca2+-binding RTX toxin-like protein
LDHSSSSNPDEIINLNFKICAIDGDGDVATTTLLIQVKDTGPIAKDDIVNMWSCDWATIGNVITNSSQENNGKDTLSVEGPNTVKSVSIGGETFSFVDGGAKAMAVQGKFGMLFMFADGSYSYISEQATPKPEHSEKFTYRIVDGDGDVSAANLDIKVISATRTANDDADYRNQTVGTNTTIDRKAAYQTNQTDGAMVFGWTKNDVLAGNSGNDALFGWEGNDTLYGYGGNDLMMGEQGNNTLYGGRGADVFDLHSGKANNNTVFDTIKDFSLTEGDVLSLSSVISGFDASDDISKFVKITYEGSTAVVKVNSDGAGADFFTVAKIESHSGLDATTLQVNDLYNKGHIDVY